MTPRTVAVIQARMSSTRLPGKVLLPLDGMPMIAFMLERVRRARSIDEIVLATSTDASDDPLAALMASLGVACHRGSLNDVLARFAGAVHGRNADVVVRLTGDCPLIDPALIDRVIDHLRNQNLDYVSNTDPPSYPDGLDVEAFTARALDEAARHARLPSEREHVTPYLYTHRDLFRVGGVSGAVDLSALRWTVDHNDDLAVVRALVDSLPAGTAREADLFDLLRALDRRPALRDANRHRRNEGYQASLQQDAATATATPSPGSA